MVLENAVSPQPMHVQVLQIFIGKSGTKRRERLVVASCSRVKHKGSWHFRGENTTSRKVIDKAKGSRTCCPRCCRFAKYLFSRGTSVRERKTNQRAIFCRELVHTQTGFYQKLILGASKTKFIFRCLALELMVLSPSGALSPHSFFTLRAALHQPCSKKDENGLFCWS